MDKIGTLPLTGKSGTKYSFEVYPMDQDFKPIGGVYAITRRQKLDHTHDVIYVGQTSDMSTRFDNHHKADCFNENNANCICVHTDDSEASQLRKEKDLIKKYSTPCNDYPAETSYKALRAS